MSVERVSGVWRMGEKGGGQRRGRGSMEVFDAIEIKRHFFAVVGEGLIFLLCIFVYSTQDKSSGHVHPMQALYH